MVLALSAAAYPAASPDNTDSPKLDLLQQAGFALFHPQRIQKQCKTLRYPSYAPSVVSTPIKATDAITSTRESKRDEITANGIFDIIRNIQDPEHPLTLEQLNVVRLELIDVVDLEGGMGSDKNGENAPSNLNGGTFQKKFSTVHVQFT